MDDRPVAALAHPHSYRLHDAAAIGGSVAGLDVHVEAAQAIVAMVAVIRASAFRGHQPPADLAGEAVIAGVGFEITFFVEFTLVFAVHCFSS